jgi:hypothetical protein
MYHHALIKLIVLDKLEKKNQTWEEFLSRNNFQENGSSSENSERDENPVNPTPRIAGILIRRNK